VQGRAGLGEKGVIRWSLVLAEVHGPSGGLLRLPAVQPGEKGTELKSTGGMGYGLGLGKGGKKVVGCAS